MNADRIFNILLLGTLSLLAAVMSVMWVAAPQIAGADWKLRLALLVVVLAVAATVAAGARARHGKRQKLIQLCIDELCRFDQHAANEEYYIQTLRHLAHNDPWLGLLEQVRQHIRSSSRRLQTAEHLRTSAEIRLQRLASQHEQMSEIVASLADPVLAIDQYDEIILINPSAQRVFQIDSGEAERCAVSSLLHCEPLVQLLTETRRRKVPAQRTAEIVLTTPNGDTRWYRVACRSIATAADGTGSEQTPPHGAVAVLSDIGGQKAIQKRQAEFVSAVSHEMKTPLAGIKAYVEMLADGEAEDQPTRDEFLGVIESQADRLQRLIDNVLNLSRIEAGVVDVHKQSISLNNLLEEAADVVRRAAEQKAVELTVDLSPMFISVIADRDMLLQAAINLLSNAIKYTPSGGKVALRSRIVDSAVQFEVEDTGVGLSPEDCRRVFEKFYRVKKDQQMASGTGLGLPLAKHIVEDVHGGRLSVTSIVDSGSTFRVTLPSAAELV